MSYGRRKEHSVLLCASLWLWFETQESPRIKEDIFHAAE